MNKISLLRNIDIFNENIKKLVLNQSLDSKQITLLLSCTLILLEEYKKEKIKEYAIFSNYILLRIANKYEIYEPLYDISVNLGFYPISRFILEKNLLEKVSINTVLADCKIENYRDNLVIETFQQKKVKSEIISSEIKEKAFIAPTSYGKSTLIYQYLKEKEFKKVAIIVPTKSLLVQTSKDVFKNNLGYKVILHEEMYSQNEAFIAVLTQERALKLLNKNKGLFFECMIIDEAHNLLDKDVRSILLSRLIRRNKFRNIDTDILYLSPLISSTENIKIDSEQYIDEQRISSSMKEPEINYIKRNGEFKVYNRFFNEFYLVEENLDYKNYILRNLKNKNFFYLFRPKNVEIFSKYIFSLVEDRNVDSLNKLSSVLSENVHEDFYCVDYIKKGILYLHGKIPDLIKEFLEHNFKINSEIKYLISNNVILEGVNLPIDNLFIMDNWGLKGKKLVNLIGRVNRLNDVFDLNRGDLNKLEPSIHFVEIDGLVQKNCNMENTINQLKSHEVEDVVKNPTLLHFNIEKFSTGESGTDQEKLDYVDQIVRDENFIIKNENDEESLLLRVLIETGIKSSYKFSEFEQCFLILQKKFNSIKDGSTSLEGSLLDKVFEFFIKDLEFFITGDDLKRLGHTFVRSYYSIFINQIHTLSVKQYINKSIKYFRARAKNDPLLYVTTSYGEVSKNDSRFKAYVDINTKSNKELVNLALIKMKIEMDFLSYKINNFIYALRELEIIDESELNLFVYGTSERKNLDLIRIGLTPSLINFLQENNQLNNLNVESNGKISVKGNFNEFFDTLDELKRFEIEKNIYM